MEDIEASQIKLVQDYGLFDLVCMLAYLGHVWNADRTIRLVDWYSEVAWRSFPTILDLNRFLWLVFSGVRGRILRVQDARVKRYVQRICAMSGVEARRPASASVGREKKPIQRAEGEKGSTQSVPAAGEV